MTGVWDAVKSTNTQFASKGTTRWRRQMFKRVDGSLGEIFHSEEEGEKQKTVGLGWSWGLIYPCLTLLRLLGGSNSIERADERRNSIRRKTGGRSTIFSKRILLCNRRIAYLLAKIFNEWTVGEENMTQGICYLRRNPIRGMCFSLLSNWIELKIQSSFVL